ncbi:uncharacterized protein LOC142333587 isoform X2 [Lycorma delicatula]|uniref:uncharacterized protein LOC142333587 isoform X2 n=1 Tax=Lycorma delicatula TaxID=130591 RepID=UPI003F515B85
MSAPVNYTSVYQTTSTINEIKIESEQIKMEETISLFLPHHMSESGYTCEDEIDSSQMKKYPLDVNYDATETDPLAIDGTNFIKSENLKIKNELEIDTTDPLAVDETEFNKTDYFKIKTERVNDNVKTEEIDIDDDYLQKFKTEEVELPSHAEETIQERTENCLSKSVNVDMNKKKYECNFCSKFLTSNYNLQKHLNKHTKVYKMPKTNAEKCKDYNKRNQAEKKKKTAERVRAYRLRQKIAEQSRTSISDPSSVILNSDTCVVTPGPLHQSASINLNEIISSDILNQVGDNSYLSTPAQDYHNFITVEAEMHMQNSSWLFNHHITKKVPLTAAERMRKWRAKKKGQLTETSKLTNPI